MEKPFPAYQGEQPYVFVCYAHADADVVYPELRRLRDSGVNVWYDEGISPGEIFTDELAGAIDGCTTFLFFATPRSVASRNCLNEIQFATARNKRVIAVHLEPTTLPPGLELSIGLAQAIIRCELDPDAYRRKLADALDVSIAPRDVPEQQGSAARARWPLAAAVLGIAVGAAAIVFWRDWETFEPVADEADGAPLTAIAVMPFDDLSPGGDQAHIAVGIAAELAESLSRIDGLRIPGRTSTTSMKRQGADIQTIGSRLDVGTVIEGSVRLAEDRLSIDAQWIRVRDETHLWSARYDQGIDDVLAMQQKIAVGIAEAIRSELGIRDTSAFLSATRYQTNDVRAWELVQRAFELMRSSKLGEARELLQRAVELDPGYVTPRSMLLFTDFSNPQGRVEGARRILEMDAAEPSALQILIGYSISRFDFETAERLLDQAIASNPTANTLTASAAELYWRTGRIEEALAAARKGVRLDPLWAYQHRYLGLAYLYAGYPAEALEALEQARLLQAQSGERTPDLILYTHLAIAYHLTGNDERAADALADAWPEDYEAVIRGGYEVGGWAGMNLALAEAAVERGNGCFATRFADAGVPERMYACLDTWLAASNAYLAVALNAHVSFEPYRQEPRFRALQQAMQQLIDGAAGSTLDEQTASAAG